MDSLQNSDLFTFLKLKDWTSGSKVMINCPIKNTGLFTKFFLKKSKPIVQSFVFLKVHRSEFCREFMAVSPITLTCLQTPFTCWCFNSALCKWDHLVFLILYWKKPVWDNLLTEGELGLMKLIHFSLKFEWKIGQEILGSLLHLNSKVILEGVGIL